MTEQHLITYINALENRIKELEADRAEGEWIDKCGNKVCACSNCGTEYDHTYEWIERWNFCPNCGAKMKGINDE